MRWLKLHGLLCIAVLSVIPTMFAVAPSANAAGSSCDNHANWFVGADSPFTTSNFGVRSQIEFREPALCSASGGSPSASSAWTMLGPETPVTQYAQVGYYKQGTKVSGADTPNGIHTFAQYTKACFPDCGPGNSVVVSATAPAPSPGDQTMYSVYLRASDDRIHMYDASTSILTMNRDVSGEWSNAWGGLFRGETWHSSTDVPGTFSNRVLFNYIQKYDSSGNLNFITTLNPFSDRSRYHYDYFDADVGGKGLKIWTDPL
jgi:hypothetical protein